ncbi:MAG TPA: hypothetical protein VF950_14660, partial [Planctomycetota bacterium]
MARLRKWSLRVAAGLAGGLLLLYLLRWPLLGGVVRGRLEQAVARHLKGELREARFSGSLLSSATAEDVVIDAPYGQLRARRVSARYGFLGLGRPEIELEGVRAAFIDPEPGKPPDRPKTVRVAEKIVRTLKFDGRLALRDGEVLLPNGERITVEEAEVDGTRLRARGRLPGFGEVVASRDGGVVEGRATDGPLRRARLEGGRYSATIEGHDVEGTVKLEYGPDDFLRRGEASVDVLIRSFRQRV